MSARSDVFDELARTYDAWFDTPVGEWADRYEKEAIFRRLALRPGERVLDIGAGTGRYAVEAMKRGAIVKGIDASDEMLRLARKRTEGMPIEFIQTDATTLPFEDASFDVVYGVTSLCFVADAPDMVREAARVLRPGGRFVIGELNRWSLWTLLRRAEALVRPSLFSAARFRSIGEFRKLLTEGGFEIVGWEGLLHLVPLNHEAYLRTLKPVEQLGQRVVPGLGAFLVVEAVKSPQAGLKTPETTPDGYR